MTCMLKVIALTIYFKHEFALLLTISFFSLIFFLFFLKKIELLLLFNFILNKINQ